MAKRSQKSRSKRTRAVGTETSAQLRAQLVLDEKRAAVLDSLSERYATQVEQAVAKEQTSVQQTLSQAFTGQGSNAYSVEGQIASAIQSYTEEILEIYYESVKPNSEISIKDESLPDLNNIINAINQDKSITIIVNKDGVHSNDNAAKKSLLDLAKKVKEILEKKLATQGKLGAGIQKLFSSDAVGAILGKAAERNPLIRLALASSEKKKNSRQQQLNINKKQLQRIQQSAARQAEFTPEKSSVTAEDVTSTKQTSVADTTPTKQGETANGTTNPPTTLGGDPTASRADRRRQHEEVWTASDGMKKLVTIGQGGSLATNASASPAPSSPANQGDAADGGSSITKILTEQTSWLEKIYGVLAGALKLEQKQATASSISAEETRLETLGGGGEAGAVMEGAGGGLLDTILESLGLKSFGKILKGLGFLLRGGVSAAFTKLMTFITEVVLPVIGAISAALGVATVAILAIKADIVAMISKAWEWLKSGVKSLLGFGDDKQETPPKKTPEQIAAEETAIKEQAQKASKGTVHAKAEDWSVEEAKTWLQKNTPKQVITTGANGRPIGADQSAPPGANKQGTPPPGASPPPQNQGTPPPQGTATQVPPGGAASEQGAQQNTAAKISLGAGVDISGTDKSLLDKMTQFSAQTGLPVRINSAYRSDKKQAELWVRGEILNEPGIFTPARPKNTTTVTVKGKQYTVQGSGIGSAHNRGDALDVSIAGMGREKGSVDVALASVGLYRPFLPKDPPHVQEMGDGDYRLATPAPLDTMAQGRSAVTSGLNVSNESQLSRTGNTIIRGGDTIIGGGGGGPTYMPIPSPIDKDPTIRRVLG